VREVNILEIPVIAMVDTNCDPDVIDFIIPSNDDAIRAIKLITSKLADAAIEGRVMREEALVEEISGYAEEDVYEDYDDYDEDLTDEELLGAATLAKIREAEEAAIAAEAEDVDTDEEE
jgi:small subunit ribosomal protein S2